MYVWKYAYKNARIGNWETAARDRDRFERRIKREYEPLLEKVLNNVHRQKMYKLIYK